MSTVVDRAHTSASRKARQIFEDSLVGIAIFSGIGALLCLVAVTFGWLELPASMF